jgi:hypothetical protein
MAGRRSSWKLVSVGSPEIQSALATSDEVKGLRRKAQPLKEAIADLTLENRQLKKSMTGVGDGEQEDIARPKRLRS